MMEPVSDEMLMAYVDGELPADTADRIRREIEATPALARRMQAFRESRSVARAAYDAVLAAPPPERLVKAIRPGRNARAPDRSIVARAALPIAACLVLIAGAGGYLAGRSAGPAGGDLLGGPELAGIVASLPVGETRDADIDGEAVSVTVFAEYDAGGDVCRVFEARATGTGVRGVGCDFQGSWSVEVAVAVSGEDALTPASAAATAVLDAYLDSIGARAR